MSGAEVIVRREGAVGRFTLNRPEALGALTTGMCEAMIAALAQWRDDPAVRAVLIDHAGPRGFCAGGDIRALTESMAGDGVAARAFFFTEYPGGRRRARRRPWPRSGPAAAALRRWPGCGRR